MSKPPDNTASENRVAVIAISRYDHSFTALDDAQLFSLFPDRVPAHNAAPKEVMRVASIGLHRDSTSEIVVGQCKQWWDLAALEGQHKRAARTCRYAHRAMIDLLDAIEKDYVSPFGDDLPLYIDSGSARSRALDWDTLEWDIFRGMNSEVPFGWRVSKRVRGRIVGELPFLDVESHFRSVVPTETLMALARRMLEQHTHEANGMSLVPLRWIARVDKRDAIIVRTGVPIVIRFSKPHMARVRVGAMDVSLRRQKSTRR